MTERKQPGGPSDEARSGVGAELRAARIARGEGLRALARRMGVSPTALSAFERGRRGTQFGADTVAALARAVGCDPYERNWFARLRLAPTPLVEVLLLPYAANAARRALARVKLGALIRARRVERGLTLSALSALTGYALSTMYLGGIENALRDCDASDVARIARALEVDADTRTAWYELLSNPIDSGVR